MLITLNARFARALYSFALISALLFIALPEPVPSDHYRMSAWEGEGSSVRTPSGPVPIEALRAGDWVVTVDVATGERCVELVLGVSAIEAERMVELAMPDGETLRATAEHPFWTERGWKAAALAAEELGAGAKEFSHREVVYNLEVKANHTYLVGRAGWVVHNACPNPNGRRGGLSHQAKVQEVEARLSKLNEFLRDEFHITTPNGRKKSRFADLAVTDENGRPIEFHQVGKSRKDGSPVSRERQAIEDIIDRTGKPVIFHPYD